MTTRKNISNKMQRTAVSHIDFYADDWLAGASELTPEQRGAFITICALYYSKQGRVPENDHWLSGMCNMSVRKWRSIKNTLIEIGKIEVIDGFIFQERSEIELENALKAKEFARINGSKGGKKSAEIRTNAMKRHKTGSSRASSAAQATVEAENQPPYPNPYPYTNQQPSQPTTARDVPQGDDFEPVEFIKLYDRLVVEIWGQPQLERMCPSQTDHITAGIFKDNGVSLRLADQVFRGILGNAKGKGNPPPSALRYFVKPMEQALVSGPPRVGPTNVIDINDRENNQWKARLTGFRDRGSWLDDWGPKPGEPECRVPRELLEQVA